VVTAHNPAAMCEFLLELRRFAATHNSQSALYMSASRSSMPKFCGALSTFVKAGATTCSSGTKTSGPGAAGRIPISATSAGWSSDWGRVPAVGPSQSTIAW
jgi:hypothetical protein